MHREGAADASYTLQLSHAVHGPFIRSCASHDTDVMMRLDTHTRTHDNPA